MYDDFAVLRPEDFETVAKEYSNQGIGKILSQNNCQQTNTEGIFKKIEYLQNLVEKLKTHTKNEDVLIVLDGIAEDLQSQRDKLRSLVSEEVWTYSSNEPHTVIFCNNLKLAIQTSSEIVKQLIDIKDSENTVGEIRPQFTEIINAFLDINNKLVSLFGECRYRTFRFRKFS